MRESSLVVVLLLVGCRGPGDAPDGGAPLADAPLADAPFADAPLADAPLADAPLADGAAPDVPTTAPDAGGGCTGACDDLFPTDVGRTLRYVVARGTRPGCADGTVDATFAGPGTDAAGDSFYTRTWSCGGNPSIDVKRDATGLLIRNSGRLDWYRFLALPPVDGAEFAAGGVSGARFTWSSLGSVTVPAGTFGGCWRRSQIGYEMSEVFCPGVGMISADYHAFGMDEGYDLTSTR